MSDTTLVAQQFFDQMTPADRAQFDKRFAEMVEHGYEPVAEFVFRGKRIAPGTRVSHCGERYVEAYRDGTANLLVVMHKPNSSWEREWHRPDVEVLALCDRDRFGSGHRIGSWADYHCDVTKCTFCGVRPPVAHHVSCPWAEVANA